ncbi:unnamed protein product, partial [Prorocentrum cordatum]
CPEEPYAAPRGPAASALYAGRGVAVALAPGGWCEGSPEAPPEPLGRRPACGIMAAATRDSGGLR